MKLSKTVRIIDIICVALVVFTAGALFLYSFIPRDGEVASIVEENAGRFSLNENLVFAVIKCESDFNSDAVSRAGAAGLMQIMPETADFIAKKIGMENYDLFLARDNICVGCAYLRYLSDKFRDEKTVLAAYNAGEGRVKEWLDSGRFSSDGQTLADIPIRETDAYVKRVLRFKRYYAVSRKFFAK